MTSPSTGKSTAQNHGGTAEVGTDHPTGPSQTSTSVAGEKSPRLPHERDESGDTYPGPPSGTMDIARDDAEGPKVATDRSDEADAAYEKLRDVKPGAKGNAERP